MTNRGQGAMAESRTGQAGRARRSTRVSRQLAQARERNNRQLVRMRERERLVDRALGDYVAATAEIEAVDAASRERLRHLEDRIRQVHADRDGQIAGFRAGQARAVLAIHTAGRTVKQVAELLDMSEKAARQLLAEGRVEPVKDGSVDSVSASIVATEAETPAYRPADRAAEPGADRDSRSAAFR